MAILIVLATRSKEKGNFDHRSFLNINLNEKPFLVGLGGWRNLKVATISKKLSLQHKTEEDETFTMYIAIVVKEIWLNYYVFDMGWSF